MLLVSIFFFGTPHKCVHLIEKKNKKAYLSEFLNLLFVLVPSRGLQSEAMGPGKYLTKAKNSL
jgi:hypothetical protein